jgi:hypothetical protein
MNSVIVNESFINEAGWNLGSAIGKPVKNMDGKLDGNNRGCN